MINQQMQVARDDARWTQAQAADALQVSRTSYNLWETGRQKVPPKQLAKFIKLAAEAKNLIGWDSVQSDDEAKDNPQHHANHLRYTEDWIQGLFDATRTTPPVYVYNQRRTLMGFPDFCEFAADTSPEGQDKAENQEENNEALKKELMRLEGDEYPLWSKVRKLARMDATGYRQELVWELQWNLKVKGTPSEEMAAVRAELRELMIRKTNERKELALGEDLV